MTAPMTITLAELPGVTLPDGTEVDWVAVPVLDRLIGLLVDEGAEAEALTPAALADVLTGLLSRAERNGERWAIDTFTLTLDDGVATVQLVAEHHDDHGVVVMLAVAA